MFENLRIWFWDEKKWLPQGFTWEDLKSTAEITRPQIEDLYIAPIIAVSFLAVRYFFETIIAVKICQAMGIKNPNQQKTSANLIKWEKVFSKYTNPDKKILKELAIQTGISQQSIAGWFRKRNKPYSQLLRKTTEAMWRCLVYFVLFLYGGYVLSKTDWLWDINKVMIGFIKNQQLTADIKWYYVLELSLYLQLSVTQMFDTRRKDFWQQYIHHVVTILLLIGSYTCGHFRFGALIMFIHDVSDFWLEGAKVTNYAKLAKASEALFIIFAITFYVSRWIYFPFWILLTFMRENSRICGKLTSYLSFPYLMLYLCFILVVLHVYWGLLIARMVYGFAVEGKIEKDARSDDEGDEKCEKENSD